VVRGKTNKRKGDKMSTMTETTRIQFEGDSGIIAILNRGTQEHGEHINRRYCETINANPAITRAKVMGIDSKGNVVHETINIR
jgi:hypothetical protein